VAISHGLIADGVILDPERAGAALRGAAEFPGSGRMRVVLGVPANRTVIRTLSLPRVDKKKFAELVEREIRRELPMLADNAHVTWETVAQHETTTDVFVLGVARDVLESHAAAARAAGLHAVSADLRIVAAARSVGLPDCVIANIEPRELEIGVFRNGTPEIIRTITASRDEGWHAHVAEELARTLKFYRDSRQNQTIVDMPVTCTGAEAPNVVISGLIPAAVERDAQMLPLRLAIEPEPESIRYAANVGLALKDLAA
jgi:hypothetical protein